MTVLPSESGPGGGSGRLARGLDALSAAIADPARRERVVAVLLAAYAVLWAAYGAIAKGSQDVHYDMGEMVAWSREIVWGSPTHPPLGSWLAGAWFGVFPQQDWAYYLFAMLMAVIGLWCAWRIAVRYLPAEKLPAALVLLMLVPFFNFHALKFNANTLMIPAWALTVWAFLRAFETRRPGWAALAGAAAAAAMLAKYWSLFLLAGLGIAALSDPRRAAYFGSKAPWITVAVGVLCLAPHLAWLATHDFASIRFAFVAHQRTIWQVVLSQPDYLGGVLAYIAVPVGIVAVGARIGGRAIADTLWPRDPDRRLIVIAFALPLLLPMLVAAVSRSEVVSLWTMGAFVLLPVVVLSSPLVRLPAVATRRIVGTGIVLPLLALALAPLVATMTHVRAAPYQLANYRLVMQAVDKVWRESSTGPLRLIGSDHPLANGMAFYGADHPATFDVFAPELTPWVDPARIAQDGIAWVCPVPMRDCVAAIEARAAALPPGRRTEIETVRVYLGIRGAPQRFLVITTPPSR